MTALERKKQRLQRLQWALGAPRRIRKLLPFHANRKDRHRLDMQRLKNRKLHRSSEIEPSLSLVRVSPQTRRIMETEVLQRLSESSGTSCILYDAIEAIRNSDDVMESHVNDPHNNMGKAYMNALNPNRKTELKLLFLSALDEIQAKPSASDERIRSWDDILPFLREYFDFSDPALASDDESLSNDPIESIKQRLEWENHLKSKARLDEAKKRFDEKKLTSSSQKALSKTSQSWAQKFGLFGRSDTPERVKEDREAEAQERAMDLLRDLTPEEQELVRDALYGDGNDVDIVARADTDTVTRKNMHTLREGEWLSDEVIHFFLTMLAKRDEELCNVDSSSRKRTHFFKSFFMTKLMNEGHQNPAIAGTYEYKNVKRWSKKVPGKDIFQLDKVVFPINVAGVHWTCAVAFMQEKRIQYYDSFNGEGWAYLETLKRYIEDEHEDKKKSPLPDADEWKLVPCQSDTPRQRNGYDCGVFTCMFADFVSKDCPLVFNQNHVNQCRERIALSILQGRAIV